MDTNSHTSFLDGLSSLEDKLSKFVTCSDCQKQYSPRATACPNCGSPNRFQLCPDCGHQCSRRAKMCTQCGAPFTTSDQVDANDKNNNVVNVVIGNAAAAAGPQGLVTGNAIAASSPDGRLVASCSSQPAQPVVYGSPVTAITPGKACDKWVAFCLCLFLGIFGAHKFYEENYAMGFLYLFTGGLFGIGVLVDLIVILFFKPSTYEAYP